MGLGGERTRRLSSVLSETFSGLNEGDRSSDEHVGFGYDVAFAHDEGGEDDVDAADASASVSVGEDEEEIKWRARGLSDCILDDGEGTDGGCTEDEKENETSAVVGSERKTHFLTAEALRHMSERPDLETDSEVRSSHFTTNPATHPRLLSAIASTTAT
jgi:hypothetical protein